MHQFHHPLPNATGSHDAMVGDPRAIAALIDRALDAQSMAPGYPVGAGHAFGIVIDDAEIDALCDLWLNYEGQVNHTEALASRLRYAQNVAACHAGNAARWQSSARGWVFIGVLGWIIAALAVLSR
jgi:hypothetical protein